MRQIRIVVATASGRVEGVWEDLPNNSPQEVATGMDKTLSDGAAVSVITDEGFVLVPAVSAHWVGIHVRDV